MDMMETLRQAADAVGTRTRFAGRHVFRKRVGKHQIFPAGVGSALDKAVREGYLRVSSDGTRRRGRTYEFTPEGVQAIRQPSCDDRLFGNGGSA